MEPLQNLWVGLMDSEQIRYTGTLITMETLISLPHEVQVIGPLKTVSLLGMKTITTASWTSPMRPSLTMTTT